MKDRGTWKVCWDEGKRKFYLESDDFTHDVYLYISGDFKNEGRQRKYAEDIARRLNETRSQNLK